MGTATELPCLSARDLGSYILRGCAEPAVIHGLVEPWPAFSLWAGRAGLQRLSSLAGHVAVEVIHGTSNGDYYGDILGHERSVYSFTRFLDCVGDAAQNNLQQGSKDEADRCAPYLAQAEMFSSSGPQRARAPLAPLLEDIILPSALTGDIVSSINLWMSAGPTASSTHYDPYHNLLCVITGRKAVTLYSPAASAGLYPKVCAPSPRLMSHLH